MTHSTSSIQGVLFLILILSLNSCGPNQLWTFEDDIQIDDVSPNGITIIDDQFWVADFE